MRKYLSLVLLGLLTIGVLGGCSSSTQLNEDAVVSTETSKSSSSDDAISSSKIESTEVAEVRFDSSNLEINEIFKATKNRDYVATGSYYTGEYTGGDGSGEMYRRAVVFTPKITKDISVKENSDSTSTMTAHIVFANSNAYRNYVNSNQEVCADDYETFKQSITDGKVPDYGTINLDGLSYEEFSFYSDKTPEDVVVVDGYSALCGDHDFSKNYNTLYGALDKAKSNTEYETSFTANGADITVSYKYSWENEKDPAVDITATFPTGYDGLRIVCLGQNVPSCVGQISVSDGETAPTMDDINEAFNNPDSLNYIFNNWGSGLFKKCDTFADLMGTSDDLKEEYVNRLDIGDQTFLGNMYSWALNDDNRVTLPNGNIGEPILNTFNWMDANENIYVIDPLED